MREAVTDFPKVIANFGSTASWTGWPSSSVYCSSKWTISGLTEGLAAEVAPFGIKAIVIEPGTFRTRFLGKACGSRQSAGCHLPAYQKTRETVNYYMDLTHNTQLGDAEKGACAIVDVLTLTGVAKDKEIPVRLPIGSDSVEVIGTKCTGTIELLGMWDAIIKSTDGKASCEEDKRSGSGVRASITGCRGVLRRSSRFPVGERGFQDLVDLEGEMLRREASVERISLGIDAEWSCLQMEVLSPGGRGLA